MDLTCYYLISFQGEGFSSFPALYEHPLTEDEEKLLEDDISRTNSCCLFFLKKGFPFVSTLKGGFAAAHAFLYRNGPDMGIPPSNVLVDYDPVASLFALLEVSHQDQTAYMNAPAREKTARTLQKIIDKSMTRLTLEEQRLNGLASDFTRPENVDKMKQSMRNLSQKVSTAGAGISFGKTAPLFMTKKFASTSKTDESTHKGEETPKAASMTSFAEKMKFKRWNQESTAQSGTEVKEDTATNTTQKGDEASVDAENSSAATTESKDDATTDSLQSIDDVSQQDSALQEQPTVEPSPGTTFAAMSQFRLKMGLSMGKATDNKVSEVKVSVEEGDSQEKSSQQNSQINTDMMKSKFASFTKSFATSSSASSQPVRQNPFAKLLHHKTEEKGTSEQKEADSSSVATEQGPAPPPTSPVKTKFDSFVFSANKLLSEISEHDDPFNPKNDRPIKTRFSGHMNSSAESITAAQPESRIDSESLLFMEDHDDGHEDEIDFSGATDLETPDTLTDPFKAVAQTNPPSEDLFRCLNPQPKEDLTQNLFDDFFDDKQDIEQLGDNAD